MMLPSVEEELSADVATLMAPVAVSVKFDVLVEIVLSMVSPPDDAIAIIPLVAVR